MGLLFILQSEVIIFNILNFKIKDLKVLKTCLLQIDLLSLS